MATWVNICDVFWPVGSIYMSYSSTSPANLFGGQWTQISGRFLYPSTSAGSTGGSNTHNHPLSDLGAACIDTIGNSSWLNVASNSSSRYELPTLNLYKWAYQIMARNPSSETAFHGTNLMGTTDNRETLPSYITVYCWRRTA